MVDDSGAMANIVRGDPQFKCALLHGDVGIQDRERHRGAKSRRRQLHNYIVKPFNAQTLKIKIDAVFAARAAPGF